jgi:hypothetical protein
LTAENKLESGNRKYYISAHKASFSNGLYYCIRNEKEVVYCKFVFPFFDIGMTD